MVGASQAATDAAEQRKRTVGVLGGGQLGRMFVHAAQAMGYRVLVLEPDRASPAGQAADEHLCLPYEDLAALTRLAQRCMAVTTEFENVPAAALQRLGQDCVVAPSAATVRICQHRAAEKAHFQGSGVPCAAFTSLESAAQLAGVPSALLPGVLKTSQLGYDGKGQRRVADAMGLDAAWAELGRVPCVLEALVPIRCEISVIVARGADGRSVHLPVQQNLHRDGILAVTQVPAPAVDEATAAQAVDMTERLARSLDFVGVLCVEFFVLDDDRVLANEMAPRPHNSGHYSIDACDVSQFELQLRTLVGLPLVAPRQHSAAVMLNLLGDLWFSAAAVREPDWARVLALPGVHLHLYGKSEPRRGRKMGHLTVTAASPESAHALALQAAAGLGIEPF